MSNKYLSQLWIVFFIAENPATRKQVVYSTARRFSFFQELFDSREIKLNNQSLCVYISRAWSDIFNQNVKDSRKLLPTASHHFPTGLLKKTVAFQNKQLHQVLTSSERGESFYQLAMLPSELRCSLEMMKSFKQKWWILQRTSDFNWGTEP